MLEVSGGRRQDQQEYQDAGQAHNAVYARVRRRLRRYERADQHNSQGTGARELNAELRRDLLDARNSRVAPQKLQRPGHDGGGDPSKGDPERNGQVQKKGDDPSKVTM